jgi:hypothetical protein
VSHERRGTARLPKALLIWAIVILTIVVIGVATRPSVRNSYSFDPGTGTTISGVEITSVRP